MKQEPKSLIHPDSSGSKFKSVCFLELKENKLYVFEQDIRLLWVLIMLRINGTFFQRF